MQFRLIGKTFRPFLLQRGNKKFAALVLLCCILLFMAGTLAPLASRQIYLQENFNSYEAGKNNSFFWPYSVPTAKQLNEFNQAVPKPIVCEAIVYIFLARNPETIITEPCTNQYTQKALAKKAEFYGSFFSSEAYLGDILGLGFLGLGALALIAALFFSAKKTAIGIICGTAFLTILTGIIILINGPVQLPGIISETGPGAFLVLPIGILFAATAFVIAKQKK